MNKKIFKEYTRDNSLLNFQVWQKGEAKELPKWVDWIPNIFIVHFKDGVADIYYEVDYIKILNKAMSNRIKTKEFFSEFKHWCKEKLSKLKEIWEVKKVLTEKDELLNFFNLAAESWPGLAVFTLIPAMPKNYATEKQIKESIEIRRTCEGFFDKTDTVFKKTLNKLYPKLKDFVKYIAIQEVMENKIPTILELKKRSKELIFYNGEIYTGIPFEKFLIKNNLFLQKEVKNREGALKELTGQVAMKGNIQGKVRIIIDKQKIANLKNGEILVTSMTTPDFAPAMRKAAAFITDEGGITCHAAIVARELKKPCIIGTKIATKILKDGDLVELDTNAGIVRILK